jgi:hypothetical protein
MDVYYTHLYILLCGAGLLALYHSLGGLWCLLSCKDLVRESVFVTGRTGKTGLTGFHGHVGWQNMRVG